MLNKPFCIARTADEIMARLAANQDSAIAERTRYTFVQHGDVAFHSGHKLLCHEVTDSRVTPAENAQAQPFISLNGTLWLKTTILPTPI